MEKLLNGFLNVILILLLISKRTRKQVLIVSFSTWFICLTATFAQTHIQCPVKVFGTTNDRCPHSHRRPPANTNNESWLSDQGGANRSTPQQKPTYRPQQQSQNYIVICNKTTTHYDIQYTLDGGRYKVAQSACNRHHANQAGNKVSFRNPAQVRNYNLNYYSRASCKSIDGPKTR